MQAISPPPTSPPKADCFDVFEDQTKPNRPPYKYLNPPFLPLPPNQCELFLKLSKSFMESNHFYYLIQMEKSSSSANKNNQNSFLFFAFFPSIVSLFERFFNLVQGVHNFFSGFLSFLLLQLHPSNTETCSDLKSRDFIDSSVSRFQKKEDHDDGSLLREEVEMVMKNLTLFCDPGGEELPEKMGSREVSGLFEEKEPSLEEVKEAFDVYDQNKDGFIDAGELQRVLRVLGLKEGFELENCRKMIRKFDENGDGMVDFREFVKFMENSFVEL